MYIAGRRGRCARIGARSHGWGTVSCGWMTACIRARGGGVLYVCACMCVSANVCGSVCDGVNGMHVQSEIHPLSKISAPTASTPQLILNKVLSDAQLPSKVVAAAHALRDASAHAQRVHRVLLCARCCRVLEPNQGAEDGGSDGRRGSWVSDVPTSSHTLILSFQTLVIVNCL